MTARCRGAHERYAAVALRASARRWWRGLFGLLETIPASPGELLKRTGSHGSRVAPHATLAWCDAMTMARARTNRREDAPAARLPPALLAKLFRSMS